MAQVWLAKGRHGSAGDTRALLEPRELPLVRDLEQDHRVGRAEPPESSSGCSAAN